MDEIFYYYRQRSGSIVHTYSEHRLKSYVHVYRIVIDMWNELELDEKANKAVIAYLRNIAIYIRRIYEGFPSCRISEMSSAKEWHMYELLCGLDSSIFLSEEDINILKRAKYTIVYGAGAYAVDTIEYLNKHNISVFAIAVSNMEGNVSEIRGIPVMQIDELCQYKAEANIVIAIKRESYVDNIQSSLEEKGFSKYMRINLR